MLQIRRQAATLSRRATFCRNFFSFPGESQTQAISLTRTLPYSPALLYSVVSNVDEYCTFVPYCTESRITEYNKDTKQPTKAILCVGWQKFEEEFESELTCDAPHTVVVRKVFV